MQTHTIRTEITKMPTYTSTHMWFDTIVTDDVEKMVLEKDLTLTYTSAIKCSICHLPGYNKRSHASGHKN
jgi:hypothetical protein